MATPLIETEGGSAVDSGDSAQTSSAYDDVDGPAVTISLGDGSSTTLHAEDLQLYIAAIQTVLLLYVTYREVVSR